MDVSLRTGEQLAGYLRSVCVVVREGGGARCADVNFKFNYIIEGRWHTEPAAAGARFLNILVLSR